MEDKTGNESIEEILNRVEGWSHKQNYVILKSLTIPGYILYSCYKDAKKNPSGDSTVRKTANKILDLDPCFISLELFKTVVASAGTYYAISSLFSN